MIRIFLSILWLISLEINICFAQDTKSHESNLTSQTNNDTALKVPTEFRQIQANKFVDHSQDITKTPLSDDSRPKRSQPNLIQNALPPTQNSASKPDLIQNQNKEDIVETGLPLSKLEVKRAFDQGRNSYLYGSYKETVKHLKPLLYPKVLIAQPSSLALAYEYLALAYFYLGKKNLAIQAFKDLIYTRPEHQLDPVRVPPNAVSLYNQLHDELQTELQQRQEALERQTALEEERQQQKLKQSIILEQQINQRLVAFLPFGAGQFQNREPGLGYFFLGSELVAAGLSAGFFWGVESLRELDGRYSRQNYSLAQSLQRAQIISGGIALGLMASGIIQALWRYQDRYNLGNYLDLDSKGESLHEQEANQSDEAFPESVSESLNKPQ